MKVKEIMKKAIAIDFDASLKEAAKIMASRAIGSLIVMKKGSIQGIITEKDFVKNASNMERKVSSVMAKQVVSIEDDEEIDAAAELMAKNKIKRLPVTHGDQLAGIITASEILEHSEDLNEDFLID